MLKIFDVTILNHTILKARKALCHEEKKFNEEISDRLKNTLKVYMIDMDTIFYSVIGPFYTYKFLECTIGNN